MDDYENYAMIDGHQVLQEEHCSGYIDHFGKWQTGFPCPSKNGRKLYCCGHEATKYCCFNPKTQIEVPFSPLTIILGVAVGSLLALVLLFSICCFKCSCCPFYKKRQPCSGGPVYQMHCSSTSSGVANMCNNSRVSTPGAESQANSARTRHTVDCDDMFLETESGEGISRNNQYDGPFINSTNSRPGSTSLSDGSTSTMSDVTIRNLRNYTVVSDRVGLCNFEPPPPYSLHQPNTFTMRPNINNQSYMQHRFLSLGRSSQPASNHNTGRHLSTFSPRELTCPQAIAALSEVDLEATPNISTISTSNGGFGHLHLRPQTQSFVPPLYPGVRQSRTANIINTHPNTDEQRHFSATKF